MRRTCVFFDDAMKENLQRMGKVNQMLVMRCEADGLTNLLVLEMKCKDMMNE